MDHNKIFTEELLPLKDKLYRFSLSIVRNPEMAQDIVQDIYLKLWNKKSMWEEWTNLEAMAMTMTRNLSLDHLKLKANNTYAIPEGMDKKDVERQPDERLEVNDMKALLRSHIALLPDLQRSVVQLRDIEGYKYNEIAEILDVSLAQVKVNLHRARIQLKTSIQEFLINEK